MKPFKPMLADHYDQTKASFPYLGSVKLDGIRCLILNANPVSRKLLDIPNDFIRGIIGDALLEGFDGELLVGPENDPEVYNATFSGVMSEDGAPDFNFWVFDLFGEEYEEMPFTERFVILVDRVKKLPPELKRFVRVVEQYPLADHAALLQYEDAVLDHGFEGVMLRRPEMPYKRGRSTMKQGHLIKLKRYEDTEAVIIGFEEEMENTNEATKDALGHTKRSKEQAGMVGKGILGKLVCQTLKDQFFEDGIEFRVAGFTAKAKADLWAIAPLLPGRIIKYKFFNRGVVTAPRHPVFKGFRSPIDL